MATVDDKKIIFSMVGVSKTIRQTNKQVLKNIYLSFFYWAKIGIIGLNGSGKSTLMKIIAGLDKDFQGEVVFSPGYSVGYLPQEPQLDPSKTVKEVVMEGVQPIVDALTEYEEINQKFGLPEYYEDEDKMNALFARQGELQDIGDRVYLPAYDRHRSPCRRRALGDARRQQLVVAARQLVLQMSGGRSAAADAGLRARTYALRRCDRPTASRPVPDDDSFGKAYRFRLLHAGALRLRDARRSGSRRLYRAGARSEETVEFLAPVGSPADRGGLRSEKSEKTITPKNRTNYETARNTLRG